MKKNKKIIHIIQSLNNGGCENMLLRTLPLINDFKHIIITLKEEGELAKKFKDNGINIINLNQQNLLNIFSYLKLLKIIKNNQPNLIITYLFHADLIGRFFIQIFANCKVIPFLRTTYNHKKYLVARIFEKITKFFVREYLANSESVKQYYIKNIGVKPRKITIIPNGIDTQIYKKTNKSLEFENEIQLKPDEIIIACVANFHINKGHKYLMEAFEKTFREINNIKLILIGNGDEKENLKNQASAYSSKNNIFFLGKRSNIPQILKSSNIFILPTLFEGMSNALMEAMASGLPCIVSDIPENKELLKNNGLYFPVKNSDEIYKQLIKTAQDKDLRKTLGEKSQKYIEDNYNLNKIASQWEEFLNQ